MADNPGAPQPQKDEWIDREAAKISAGDLGPFNPAMVAVHPMSTMWMGSDPKTSVVDSYGVHHRLEGLYVADGSLFPSSIGGPPQIPIYTMGRRVARRVVDDLPPVMV